MHIAVTGASGYLGGYMVPWLRERGHTVSEIGRDFPLGLECDALFHLAAPNHRDTVAVADFAPFAATVAAWSRVTNTPTVSAATWWEYAGPVAEALPYTRLKAYQHAVTPGAHLVLFSVYHDGTREARGFIPQLVAHATGGPRIAGASRQPRRWVHAEDVCKAFLWAAASGACDTFEVAESTAWSPRDLVVRFTGEQLPDYTEFPPALPACKYRRAPLEYTSVLDYVERAIQGAR